MFSSVSSFGLTGIACYPVTVEADVSRAFPCFEIVGLPDAAVKESKDRVRSAMKNCGMEFPSSRVVVNLAPADTKKTGAIYDLPILVGILCSTGALPALPEGLALVGELSLDGHLRPVNGILSMVADARRRGLPGIIIPRANAAEGAVFPDFPVYAADSVEEVLRHLRGEETLPLASNLPVSAEPEAPCPDFADVKGQPVARRAAEVAAAGGHNLLLLGSPGSGKSMIAQRLPSILPELSFEESIETTQIHSIAGLLPQGVSLLRNRPFRAPHHTVSAAGLTGGGSNPRPGEISLAHNGVLFLDELPEFSRSALEALRQPMENSRVTISRAGGSVTYPSRIMAVAAMNPCPCGYYGHPDRPCTCTPSAIKRYLGRVSGPLLDRLDIQVEVAPVRYEDLASASREEGSAAIRERVAAARKIQQTRLAPYGESCNARIPAGALGEICPLTPAADRILQMAFERLNLSGRAYDRILKIARTIADLDGSERIDTPHITEAIQYRSLDRKYWAGR